MKFLMFLIIALLSAEVVLTNFVLTELRNYLGLCTLKLTNIVDRLTPKTVNSVTIVIDGEPVMLTSAEVSLALKMYLQTRDDTGGSSDASSESV